MRLIFPIEISLKIDDYFKNLETNKKLKALVTAGPTREYIDTIRYITNRSSGKQGYAIADNLNKNGYMYTTKKKCICVKKAFDRQFFFYHCWKSNRSVKF